MRGGGGHARSGMELGKEWLRLRLRSSPDHKQRGPIVAGDQVSCQGHQCSETSLTGEPSSLVSVGASPERKPLPPRREANGWPIEPVRLCFGVKLQGLHKSLAVDKSTKESCWWCFSYFSIQLLAVKLRGLRVQHSLFQGPVSVIPVIIVCFKRKLRRVKKSKKKPKQCIKKHWGIRQKYTKYILREACIGNFLIFFLSYINTGRRVLASG